MPLNIEGHGDASLAAELVKQTGETLAVKNSLTERLNANDKPPDGTLHWKLSGALSSRLRR